MKKIALYGGAFDPPHHGHTRIIESLCKTPNIDEIWLLPCGDRLDKKLLIPTQLRFQLLKTLFKDNRQIKVSQDEILMSRQRREQIQTYDLLNEFKKRYIWAKFYFVIGADILHSIHSWDNAQKLQKEHNFIVFNRKGYELERSKLPLNSLIIENQSIEVSSSYLKGIIKDENLSLQQKEKMLKPWISQLVLEILKNNKLI